jgi:hypothetical protein
VRTHGSPAAQRWSNQFGRRRDQADMKNPLYLMGGVVGATLGFVAGMLAFDLVGSGSRNDPIAAGLMALLLFGPLGAIAGAVLGTQAVMRLRRRDNAGGLARNSLQSLALVVSLTLVAGGSYYVYAATTATPWLNPNAANPVLQFEARLPPGAAAPAQPGDVAVELQTDLKSMPGELRGGAFRRDGVQPVIAGEVELAFRTAHRQLQLRTAGQPDRLFRIGLAANAPHTAELGPWQTQPDGSAIRYRARWPGRD